MKWKSKDKLATKSQLELIGEISVDIRDYDRSFDLISYCKEEFGKSLSKLTINEASDLIKFLIAERRYFELSTEVMDEIY